MQLIAETATQPHISQQFHDNNHHYHGHSRLPRKLWEHPDPTSTAMWRFMQDSNARHGLQMQVGLLSRFFLLLE